MKNRVLVVGTIERGPACIRALQSLGHESRFFDFRQGCIYKNKFVRGIFHRFPVLKPLKRFSIDRINSRLIKEVQDFKPDVLVSTVAENITPETLSAIRSMGVTTANWFTDFQTRHWPIIERLAPAYDYFYSSDGTTLEKLHARGLKNCFYLPEAIEDLFGKSPFDGRKDAFGITFIGSYNPKVWQHREKFLAAVKDLGVNVWGPEHWQQTSLKTCYRGTARGKEMFEIYRSSKIAVDIPWDDGVAQGIGMRPFEVMASGACFFIYDVRKDMSRIFQEGVHYISFRTEDEFRSKADYYLRHEEERRLIARTAYETVMSEHTFVARMKTLLSRISAGNPRT